MPSDSQNKAEKPESNVVALHRAEFVASIEKKLSEARRFFSLRDYGACEELVQEVLAADPQNSKAKALLDLSAIKLSKRKLYKKIADVPSSAPRLADGKDTSVTTPVRAAASDPRPADETSARPEPPPSLSLSRGTTDQPNPRRHRSRTPDLTAGLPQDSMRERTISALVDLLKNKEATVHDVKAGAKSSRTPPTLPSQPEAPLPLDPPSKPESSELRAQTPALQRPPVSAYPLRQPSLEVNRDSLPDSLEELFEAGPKLHAQLPQVRRDLPSLHFRVKGLPNV